MYNVRRRKMPKKNIYTCPTCKHIFDDYDDYKEHLEEKAGSDRHTPPYFVEVPNEYPCDYATCPFSTKSIPTLKHHLKTHYDPKDVDEHFNKIIRTHGDVKQRQEEERIRRLNLDKMRKSLKRLEARHADPAYAPLTPPEVREARDKYYAALEKEARSKGIFSLASLSNALPKGGKRNTLSKRRSRRKIKRKTQRRK